MSLRKLRIGQRLALAFGALIALMVVGAAFAAFELTQLRGHQQEIAAQLQRGQQAKADEAMARLDQTLSTATAVLSISTVVGIVAAALLGAACARSVTRPLVAARAAAERMADGDMSVPVLADGSDEAATIVGILGRKHIDVLGRARKAEEDCAPLSDEEILDPGGRERLGYFLRLQRIERRAIVHSGGAG